MPQYTLILSNKARHRGHIWRKALELENGRHYEGEKFRDIELSGVDLKAAHFIKCDLRGANFKEVVTTGCLFSGCNFTGARFGASFHKNSYFTNCNFEHADMFGAKFDNCKMTGSIFKETIITGLSIVEGDWSYINFRHANLKGFDLKKVCFKYADFYGSNLEKADLRGADLENAVLQKAKLFGADLRGARLDGIDFRGIDLNKVKIDLMQAASIVQSYGVVFDFMK